MPSYRFCRPDDLPLLIKAINTCVYAHTPGKGPIDEEGFKKLHNDIQLWASSCCIAYDKARDDIIATCLGCKREHETLIHLYGARPDHLREGHVFHLIDSLCKKVAVLGPLHLIAEVPTHDTISSALFIKLGYKETWRYQDYTIGTTIDSDMVSVVEPIEVASALDLRTDMEDHEYPWIRQRPSLIARHNELKACAIISADHLEAACIYRIEQDHTLLLRLYSRRQNNQRALYSALLATIQSQGATHLKFNRSSPIELSRETADAVGFQKESEHIRFHRIAEAA